MNKALRAGEAGLKAWAQELRLEREEAGHQTVKRTAPKGLGSKGVKTLGSRIAHGERGGGAPNG